MSVHTQSLELFSERSKGEQALIIGVWIVSTFIFAMFGTGAYMIPTSVGVVFGIIIGLVITWATLSIISTR